MSGSTANMRRASPTSCRAASASASPSRAGWSPSRRCCSATKSCRRSTCRCRRASSTLLQRLKTERGIAMLFISHDLAVVRMLADRVCVLFRGDIMEIGRRDQVFAAPFHPYTHSLLEAVPTPLKPHPQRGAGTEAASARRQPGLRLCRPLRLADRRRSARRSRRPGARPPTACAYAAIIRWKN